MNNQDSGYNVISDNKESDRIKNIAIAFINSFDLSDEQKQKCMDSLKFHKPQKKDKQ